MTEDNATERLLMASAFLTRAMHELSNSAALCPNMDAHNHVYAAMLDIRHLMKSHISSALDAIANPDRDAVPRIVTKPTLVFSRDEGEAA